MSNNLKFLIGGLVIAVVVIVGYDFVEKKKKDKPKESIQIESYSFGANNAGQNNTVVNPTNPSTGNTSTSSSGEKTPELSNDSGFAPVGSYEVYSPEKIAEKSKTSRVVLFFNATWCPTCRALDNSIKVSTKQIPGDVTILSVDYDTYKDLKKKYGVTYQHTLVQVDADGNMIKKWSGSSTLASLIKEVR